MTSDALREQFPHVEHTVYVNHAATSPLSRPVKQAMGAYLEERHAADPAASIENYDSFRDVVSNTRKRLARLVGTTPDRIAFARNTSAGLNVLAQGLDWQPGDRVAVPGCEFPANVYPFMNLEREGVSVDFVPHEEGTVTLEAIEQAIQPETRLLTLSWVQFLSGFRADMEAVGALCHAHDLIFCVDAIQGLGALQLDVEACGVDFLACGGHKWLMATQGIGFLYCSEALQEQLHPAAGWLHGPVDWENFFDYELSFHPDARRFEIGTMNSVGIAALHAALGLYFECEPEWVEARVLERAQTLAEGLDRLGYERYGTSAPEHASGVVTIHADAPDELQAHLKDRQIECAVRNRKVRFAPTYYNSADEMERILDAVAEFE